MPSRRPSSDAVLTAVSWAALLKCALGLVGLLNEPADTDTAVPSAVYALMLVAFAVTGTWLAFWGKQDRRAASLGAFFLVTSSAFSARGLAAIAASTPHLGWFAQVTRLVSLESLSPWLLWSFVGGFPRGPWFDGQERVFRVCHRASLLVGLVLLLAQPLVPLSLAGNDPPAVVDSFYRFGAGTLYWAVLLGGQALALAFAGWRSRHARVEERRRVRLLLGGLFLGSAPLTLVALLGAAWPRFEAWVSAEAGVRALAWIIYPGLMIVPISAAYAVLVNQALDVRLVVRRAVQYTLVRGSAFVAIAFPSVLLVGLFYRSREQSLTALVAGPGAPLAGALSVAALVAFQWRRRLLDSVDRAFFREQYDARRTLEDLISATRQALDPAALGTLISRELDRALHVDSAHLLVIDRASGHLVGAGSSVRPVRAHGVLARHLQERPRVHRVEWNDPGGWQQILPVSESSWLVDSGARLISGLRGHDGGLVGLLAIGDKKSELPFTVEDRRLVGSVGAAASLAVDRWLASVTPAPVDRRLPIQVDAATAHECPGCGLIALDPGACPECGSTCLAAPLPPVVGGQYRLERRIGRGGTGVVYRAFDLRLARLVAVKTLPPVSIAHTHLLRREARAAAALFHPCLAAIFDYESWNGVPILVFEYLEGGTLSDRLKIGPVDVKEALGHGMRLAEGLQAMHAEGILHRDVKPSNIGFTYRGDPKLLDLGIALVMGIGDSDASPGAMGSGTPDYMAPEAIDGFPPTPAFDIWGLTVCLYEAIAGRYPFRGSTLMARLARIGSGEPPDLRADMVAPPREVVEFFRGALSRGSHQRPRTASQLHEQLGDVLSALP